MKAMLIDIGVEEHPRCSNLLAQFRNISITFGLIKRIVSDPFKQYFRYFQEAVTILVSQRYLRPLLPLLSRPFSPSLLPLACAYITFTSRFCLQTPNPTPAKPIYLKACKLIFFSTSLSHAHRSFLSVYRQPYRLHLPHGLTSLSRSLCSLLKDKRRKQPTVHNICMRATLAASPWKTNTPTMVLGEALDSRMSLSPRTAPRHFHPMDNGIQISY